MYETQGNALDQVAAPVERGISPGEIKHNREKTQISPHNRLEK